MPLSPTILADLARIGATQPQGDNPVLSLVHEVVWPNHTFTRRRGSEGPLICGLRFLQSESRGRFWDGWEDNFAGVDPSRLFPLACDDYYFYFVAKNERDDLDPEIYSVDHEETDGEPFSGRFRTIGELLSVIEAEESKDQST